MKAHVEVEGGVCGFKTRIQAEGDDSANVTFQIESECEKIRIFGKALMAKSPVDGYEEIAAGSDGVILSTSRGILKACCAGCITHAAVFKAMQVAAGLALPKDITLKISAG
jgi:hypothetical protein